MYIGGLDIGTSGCKIAVYDETGTFYGSEYAPYDVSRNGGLHEINAAEIFACVKDVFSRSSVPKLSSVAVTSFGETFVMLDEHDAPCAPSLLYTDPRGQTECDTVCQRFGKEHLAFLTGAAPHPMYSLSKIMWIKNNMPEAYNRARHILLMQDYIVYMLCGVAQIDYSLAARTACFDIENKCWAKDILDFCEIDEALLSRLVPSGTPAGKIKPNLAKELGQSEDLLVVTGCHDQIAAMTGANVLTTDTVMDGTGTVECVPLVMESVPKDFSLFEKGYSFVPHINGKYACYVVSYTGGATLKWFCQNFSDKSYAQLDNEVSDAPTDLIIMPHFAGAATPYMDSGSTAAVLGLTFEHTASDFYKGLMEGTAYEMAVNLDILKAYDLTPKYLIATGGGARSRVWLQIKADVLGLPVAALDTDEAGAAGTAYFAGKAVGIFDEKTQLAHTKETIYPIAENHTYYQKQLQKYKKVYSGVNTILERTKKE